jgi:hypothetical protein
MARHEAELERREMAARIEIKGLTGKHIGSVVSIPGNSETQVSLENIDVEHCIRVIEERDPLSLAAALGLPADTPPELIIQAAKAIQIHGGPDEEKADLLKDLPVWSFIQRASEVATVIGALITLSAQIAAAFS